MEETNHIWETCRVSFPSLNDLLCIGEALLTPPAIFCYVVSRQVISNGVCSLIFWKEDTVIFLLIVTDSGWRKQVSWKNNGQPLPSATFVVVWQCLVRKVKEKHLPWRTVSSLDKFQNSFFFFFWWCFPLKFCRKTSVTYSCRPEHPAPPCSQALWVDVVPPCQVQQSFPMCPPHPAWAEGDVGQPA